MSPSGPPRKDALSQAAALAPVIAGIRERAQVAVAAGRGAKLLFYLAGSIFDLDQAAEEARAAELQRQAESSQRARQRVLQLWIIVYAFVGTQMAWTLRPFFGAPGLPFEPFRQLGGNFYTNIIASLAEVLGFGIVR